MTDITELTSVQKNANIHRLSRLIAYAPNDELRQMAVEVEHYTDQLIEALEKAQQRIYQLESSAVTVKLPNSNDERFWGYGSEFEVELYDSCVFCALAAAGIKVEAE